MENGATGCGNVDGCGAVVADAIGMAKLAELTGTGAVTGVGVVVVVDGGETGGAIGVGVG